MVQAWLWGLGAVATLVGLVALYHYNRMVQLENRCEEAWSNVDTELKRRHDLIPNLVETVEGYAQHEQALIEAVTEARAHADREHAGAQDQAADEAPLVRGVERLLAVAEAYPELQADEGFRQLQEELAITEDRIQAARRFYNGNVRDYLNLIESFPGNVFADLYGFEEIAFFEVDEISRTLPPAEV